MDPVTENENALKQWKEETRKEALENEVKRLKTHTTIQAIRIRRIKLALLATIALLVVSLGTIWILSSENEKPRAETVNHSPDKENSTKHSPSVQTRELNIISPISDTIKFRVPENGIIFSIQIGAYLSHDLQKFNDNMISLHQYSAENINQFTLGLFTNYTEALEFKDMVKQLGFTDAYITALKNGKRIKVQDAFQETDLQKTAQ